MRSEIAVETVGGVPVRITRHPDRPLILLTRMASGGMGIWDAIWDDLAQRFSVANFDLVEAASLGRELSPRERFLRLGEVTADVARGLGHERFHLFGWYGGCHVALATVLQAADRVASLVLLDPFFELDDMRKVEAGIGFKRAIFEQPDRALYARYWVMAGFSPHFLETRYDEVERLTAARVGRDRFVREDAERWLRWVRALRTNWLSDAELGAISIPTLVLASELDSWHAGPTVGMAEALVGRLGAAELRVIRGLGTFFFIESPETFHEVAGPFLDRVRGL